MKKDSLSLVAIFYYFSALLVGGVAWLPSAYVIVSLLLSGPTGELKFANGFGGLEPIFELFGSALWVVLWGFMLSSLALTLLFIYTGRCLRIRQRRMFCQIMSVALFLTGPLGIAVGIFTLVQLGKPEIYEQFANSSWLTKNESA
jgi:hypothetical protein